MGDKVIEADDRSQINGLMNLLTLATLSALISHPSSLKSSKYSKFPDFRSATGFASFGALSNEYVGPDIQYGYFTVNRDI